MIKKLFLFISLIILALIFKFTPYACYLHGNMLMKKQEYQKAYSSYKIAYNIEKKNKNYKFAYVKALTRLSPTIPVQKELFLIANSDENDSAQASASIKISKWRELVLQNYGDNYIEQTPINNKILRWNTEKFPIKVSIVDNSGINLPQYYRIEILRAFTQWQKSSGFLKFSLINNSSDANIMVEIVQIPPNLCDGNTCQYVVGFTVPEYSGDTLKNMLITLYATDPYGRLFSDKELYNTILHEIGHSLGIMGHSYNSGDLMYMSQESATNSMYAKYRSSFQYLSSKDINTIKLLYKLAPDITNGSIENTKGLVFAPIILGTSKDIASRKLKEAQNYVKKAPNLPNGYIDLATAYADLGRPKEALKALYKAYEYSKTNDEKYITAYNLSSFYLEVGDTKNAMKFAEIAKNISSTPEVAELISNIKIKSVK